MLFIAAVLAVRFVTWVAQQVTQQLDEGFTESDALVRSEATKHRQAVASVIQWVSIVIIAIWVIMQIADVLQFSVGGLIAPATVLGAALGFGAQQLVKDLLSGFFIIVEKQYGFGDLVSLTVAGIAAEARGTVENVTLRVTRLRSSEGELFTIPNGQIVKTVNLSKDWARAVIDIPVSTSADLNRVNEVLHQECEHALDNPVLGALLLDAPTVMGIESIEVDTVTLRVVARTLPGKQFEAGRQLRVVVIRALERAGIFTTSDARVAVVDDSATPAAEAGEDAGCGASAVKFTLNVLEKRSDDDPKRRWPGHMLGGRVRTSTLVLIVLFLAVWWTYDTYKPQAPSHDGPPATQVVPPGFVPDPNYTWVPRTRVEQQPDRHAHTDAHDDAATPAAARHDDDHVAAFPAADAAVRTALLHPHSVTAAGAGPGAHPGAAEELIVASRRN